MKPWAILTAALYGAILLLLTVPIIVAFFPVDQANRVGDAILIYKQWGYWIWFGIMVAGQGLLLLVPVNLSERKLIPRRRLLIPVIVAALLFANIVFGTVLSVAAAAFGDKGLEIFAPFGDHPIGLVLNILLPLGFWAFWAVVFHRSTKTDAPDAVIKKLTRWLLRGSILELLVAVPSHVIVRHRDDCCAPMGPFWGITTGISVMLFCFGPGVFFLFADRFNRLRPKNLDASAASAG